MTLGYEEKTETTILRAWKKMPTVGKERTGDGNEHGVKLAGYKA